MSEFTMEPACVNYCKGCGSISECRCKKPDEALEQASDKFSEKWHKQFPDGQTVSPYCNHDMPSVCFEAGAQFERERARCDNLSQDEITDSQRLDFIIQNGFYVVQGITTCWIDEPIYEGGQVGGKHKTARDAIDACIKAERL